MRRHSVSCLSGKLQALWIGIDSRHIANKSIDLNPSMDTLKLQSNGSLHNKDGWYTGRWWVGVTFGTARRGMGGLRPSAVLPAAVVLAHGQPPVWCWMTYDVWSSYDDVTGRHSICRRRTACLEQPSSCHPWSVTVAVNLRKAAENLFVCLRVAALVTHELAPLKCTD